MSIQALLIFFYRRCVVGKDDALHEQGTLPVAYIVCEDGYSESSIKDSIIARCTRELPEYSQPDEIIFIDSLPKTSIGKVDYRALEKSKL